MKAKRAKPARVYPAESDPRQVNDNYEVHVALLADFERRTFAVRDLREDTTAAIAREFGPWVKAEDGSWFRDRSKRRRKR